MFTYSRCVYRMVKAGGSVMAISGKSRTRSDKKADLTEERDELEAYARSLGAEVFGVAATPTITTDLASGTNRLG